MAAQSGRQRHRTALVTGGSRGIGRAVVERMAGEGASVVFCFRSGAEAAADVEASTAAAGAPARGIRTDLARRGAGTELFAAAEEHLGGVDILVNNAGSDTVPRPIGSLSDAGYDAIMDVNARAVFELMRAAAGRLRDGGRIVNVSTLNTSAATAAAAVHAASKSAVEQFAAGAAHELGPRGITVNCVAPGATDTALLHGNNPGVDVAAAVVPRTPLGRLGTPDDIAAVVVFLAGPDAGWVTGQTIRVAGGLG
ncbi:SDR family NAD(P)-dependent oxidoreductase [Nocardiopsis coralliicola]